MKKINFTSGLGFKYEVSIELDAGRVVIKEVYNKSKDLLCQLVPLANGGVLATCPNSADNQMVINGSLLGHLNITVVELVPKFLGQFA